MKKTAIRIMLAALTVLTMACSGPMFATSESSRSLRAIVAPVQQSVVTVAAFDLDGDLMKIGSGFFIGEKGELITNYHVLDGAYTAMVKTADGKKHPIVSVLSANQLVDLMKVRVEIAPRSVHPVPIATREPVVTDRVVVIGSPMGLAHTVSEGIVSAVRSHPVNGNVYQLTAPISTGSSGGPAINTDGEVMGVVTFQAAKGQNINFAVSIQSLQLLVDAPMAQSIAEWTIQRSKHDPRLAAALCSKGAQLSIKGKYEAALDYFQRATEIEPDDPGAWYGLGSCYIGMNRPEDAVSAFNQAISADPDNPAVHFALAMYYKVMQRFQDAVAPLKAVTRIDPKNAQAWYELAGIYGALDQYGDQIDALNHILGFEPRHVPALHMMGSTARKAGRYDEALDYLYKASTLEPKNARIHFDIGITYQLQQRPDEERRAYTRAIAADPKMAAPHYHLGLLFLAQGDRKLALDQYTILRALDAAEAAALFERIYPEVPGDGPPPTAAP